MHQSHAQAVTTKAYQLIFCAALANDSTSETLRTPDKFGGSLGSNGPTLDDCRCLATFELQDAASKTGPHSAIRVRPVEGG